MGMATYGADSITVLEGLEAVRKRPGMYIGSVTSKGLNHLVYEIVDNAVDEHLSGYCNNIWVTLEKDGSATVEDDGRGIPVEMHKKGVSATRLIFTTLHAGGKFDDSAYKTSGGLHGVGSSVVNALSEFLDVQVSRDGVISHDRYEKGIPVIELEEGLLPVIGKTKKTGTKVNFLPDAEIFEKIVFKAEDIKRRLHETAYLNPKLTIYFKDLRNEVPIDYDDKNNIPVLTAGQSYILGYTDEHFGIKEANGDISSVVKTISICWDNIDIYSGNDEQAIPIMSVGGKGVISVFANICPKISHDICSKFLNGDIKESNKIQREYYELMSDLFCDVNPIPVKAAMNILGFECGECRMPLNNLNSSNFEKLKNAMRKYKLI